MYTYNDDDDGDVPHHMYNGDGYDGDGPHHMYIYIYMCLYNLSFNRHVTTRNAETPKSEIHQKRTLEVPNSRTLEVPNSRSPELPNSTNSRAPQTP